MNKEIHDILGKPKSNKIEILIPSNCDYKSAHETLINEVTTTVENALIGEFGGVTTYNALGSYYNKFNEVGKDNIRVITTYSFDISKDKLIMIRNLCEYIKETMLQECVMVTINNESYFI